MNWRNRIVGSIAVVFGLVMTILLVMDGRWNNHDSVKPIKSLLGGLLFICLGAWYLHRGAKAEPWKDQQSVLPSKEDKNLQSKLNHLDLESILMSPKEQQLFQAERQKLETEIRQKARELEKTSYLGSEHKDTPNAL